MSALPIQFDLDSARRISETVRAVEQKSPGIGTHRASPIVQDGPYVYVQNQGTSDCPYCGIIGFDNVVGPFNPASQLQQWQQTALIVGNKPYVNPQLPTAPDPTRHRCNFGVAIEIIRSEDYGRCVVSGIVPVQVYLDPTLTGVMAADVKLGDNTQLTLTPGGYRLVYLQAGSPGSTVWGLVHMGNKEPPLYAQQTSSQDGTHPIGQYRTYTLALAALSTPGIQVGFTPQTPPINVPVMNNTFSVPANVDLRQETSIITGLYGQYQLTGVPGLGGDLLRGTLQGALSDGGTASVAAVDENFYTVHEVLGLNGGSIPANKKVWFAYNAITGQYEVLSAGC